MPTVSKEIADDVIAGKYDDDPPVVKIIKYENQWGNFSYGLVYDYMDPDTYRETEFVINPQIYWEP